ncbi:MAG: IclR family transcriptional regulator C-terminal domain-containing protein [Actinomycetota bacterium]
MSKSISGVGVLDKAIVILDALAVSSCTLNELMAATGLPRATAYRLATALEAHRLVARDAAGQFCLGGKLAELARGGSGVSDLAPLAVERLRDLTGESAQVYVRQGDQRVCVAAAERPTGLRDSVPVGAVLPLTAGSAAQVLLAWAAAADRDRLLAHAAFTDRALASVRRRGWAESVGERESGVASVSAPVVVGEQLVAAISVSGPIDRLGRTPGRRFAAAVQSAAHSLAAALT